MRVVQSAQVKSKNRLELSTLQQSVITHLNKLISNPNLLLDEGSKAIDAMLDGCKWIDH